MSKLNFFISKFPTMGLWLFICLAIVLFTCCLTKPVKISSVPIVMKLKRFNKLSNDSEGQIRTRPLLFQNVLKLSPGNPFHLSFDRWKALKECGLFRNLTAHAIMQNDGAQLEIAGMEMPCITFAPELSLGSSLSHPNIAGGFIYRNKNFRGLGENLELMMAKREVVDMFQPDLIEDLGTSTKIKWKDCSIGRVSDIELNYEHDMQIAPLGNLFPVLKHMEKVVVSVSKLSTIVTSQFSNAWGSMRPIMSLEPYISEVKQENGLSYILSGAKARFDYGNSDKKFSSSVWLDCGHVSNSFNTDDKFTVMGGMVKSPTVIFPGRIIPWKIKMRGFCFQATGSGIIPHFHLQSLNNHNLIRCGIVDRSTRNNFVSRGLSAKIDFYMKPITNILTVGWFSDCCAYQQQLVSEHAFPQRILSTFGFSLRAHGIRVDVGIPFTEMNLSNLRFNMGLDQGD